MTFQWQSVSQSEERTVRVVSTALTPFEGLVHQSAFAEERASILRFLIYVHYNIGSAAGLVNYLTSNIYSVLHKVFSYKFNLHRMPYKNISKVLISLISSRGNGSLTLYECTKIDAHYPSASNIYA